MRKLLAAAAIAALASPALAQELVLGAGHSAFLAPRATDSAVVSLAWHSRPLGQIGKGTVSGIIVADLHAAGDRFAGIGLAARWPLRSGWFVEAGLAPGAYRAGKPGNDLGSDLEIRSHLAIGRSLGGGRALSVAFVHKSNAGTGRINPGMHTVLLRWHQAF